MEQKKKIKEALKDIEFHANWNIEKTSKSFKSIKQSIKEHLQDKESFTIEVLFLESYLYMSECTGNSENEKDISKAMEKNDEAFDLIQKLSDGPIKDGYKSIYLAMSCWISVKDQPDISSYENLEQLLIKYRDVDGKKKFQASICVTKALAYSKLSFSRYNESESQLIIATEACPNNAEWLFMLGLIKCRRCKIKLRKNRYSSNLIEVERIMKRVLELKSDHAYAMVILADIKRRQYEHDQANKSKTQSSKTNASGYNLESENDYDENINTLLKQAIRNASRPKIFSEIAQCFIHMGRHFTSKGKFPNEIFQKRYFQEARDVIDLAKKEFEIAACVILQEAVLYREQGMTKEQLKCLDYVIDKKPSNVGAKIQMAHTLLRTQRQREGFAMYKNLLVQFQDPFDLFDINRNYASSLAVKKKFNESYDKNIECLEIALGSFVKENSSEQAGNEVKFIEEEEEQVKKIIGHIENHLNLMKTRSEKIPKKINAMLELARIHEKIGRYKDACSEYNEALRYHRTGENHDGNQEIEILLKLTNAYIKLSVLSDAEKTLEEIKDADGKHQDNINKLKIDLAVAKGEKEAKSGEHAEAIKHFVCAAKMGSVEGAKRLFREMKEEPIHQDFIKNCALVKKCTMATSGNGSMLDDLNELVRSYDNGCLMHSDLHKIRKCQLEMEYCYLLNSDNSGNIDNVIHKCRSSLNHAMTRFKNDRYPRAINKHPKGSTDFFIAKNDAKNDIVRAVTKTYGWTDFPTKYKEFLDFLVSIQPVTDPKNNWIKELIDLDNDEKHSRSPQDVNKSFFVAREACIHIRPILEEFCKYFKPQPTSPSQT